MCKMWSEICGGRDYLGSNISRMSLSKPFLCSNFVFKTGQLIIWGLWKVGLIIWGSEKVAWHQHPRSKSQGVPPWGSNLLALSSLSKWDSKLDTTSSRSEAEDMS